MTTDASCIKHGNSHVYTTDLARNNHAILAVLLKDQTLSRTNGRLTCISWATDDYSRHLASSPDDKRFAHCAEILPELVSGEFRGVIVPRVMKHEHWQASRQKERAEVFTPAWICNAQNNLIDERWFGRREVFNKETVADDGAHSWSSTEEPIVFPEGKTWMAYVRARRMEITCGEAPYLVSRYDTTTGQHIDIRQRIGLLDRKFRIINENTPCEPTKANKHKWLRRAYQALQSVYGFDWQGDNVFLTRESLLHSFCDYYVDRWRKMPHIEAIKKAAEIISWNIWQMDGTCFKVPNTDTYALIMEWHGSEPLSGKCLTYGELVGK